jgi:hypothetical protein
MTREVGNRGGGSYPFWQMETDRSPICAAGAAVEALRMPESAGDRDKIDQLLLSTMGAQTLNHRAGWRRALVDTLNLRPAMAERWRTGRRRGLLQ